MGVRSIFSRVGQHFACPFKIADDAMQIDVHETLYLFYAPKGNAPCHGRRKREVKPSWILGRERSSPPGF